jgi:PilZ domain
MNLKCLLLSSDEKAVRILRRVLSDMEIEVEHFGVADEAIRRITRQRFEAIIVDAVNARARDALAAAKAAPVNKRALSIVVVEGPLGLKGGFQMGAHFVLHKPFAVERAKASFRAVRALMKRERRLQMRVPVEIPVECFGARQYKGKSIDICEGGMMVQFSSGVAKESSLRFSLKLPGNDGTLELHGEVAWEGAGRQAGVRFKNATDEQRNILRQWLNKQLPEQEPDDPPVNCRLTQLSSAGCYLTTASPFPRGTRVSLTFRTAEAEVRASGLVLVMHPEFGMGVELLRSTTEQREQAQRMTDTLRAHPDKTPEFQVEPDGLELAVTEDSAVAFQASSDAPENHETQNNDPQKDDALVALFRRQFEAPVETFLQQMRQQHQAIEAPSSH